MEKVRKYIQLISLLAIIFVFSCNKDNGTATSISRSTLLGKWLANEIPKKNTYEVEIQIDSTISNGVLISNFGGSGQTVKAKASLTGNVLSLSADELLTNGWIVNGNGNVSSTIQINWSYSIHDGANLSNYTAVFTKE
jgi:hypothetical protein